MREEENYSSKWFKFRREFIKLIDRCDPDTWFLACQTAFRYWRGEDISEDLKQIEEHGDICELIVSELCDSIDDAANAFEGYRRGGQNKGGSR